MKWFIICGQIRFVIFLWTRKFCYLFTEEVHLRICCCIRGSITHMFIYCQNNYSNHCVHAEQLLKCWCTGGAITQMFVYRRINYSNDGVQGVQLLKCWCTGGAITQMMVYRRSNYSNSGL